MRSLKEQPGLPAATLALKSPLRCSLWFYWQRFPPRIRAQMHTKTEQSARRGNRRTMQPAPPNAQRTAREITSLPAIWDTAWGTGKSTDFRHKRDVQFKEPLLSFLGFPSLAHRWDFQRNQRELGTHLSMKWDLDI